MKKINILIKHPGEKWEMVTIADELKEHQRLVGGRIECVPGVAPNTIFIVNDEGKWKGLTPNFAFRGDVLVGNVLCVGVSGEDFTDCPITAHELNTIFERR